MAIFADLVRESLDLTPNLKPRDATKKKRTSSSLRAWESTESLPLNFGFWLAAGGVEGWACRLVGLI